MGWDCTNTPHHLWDKAALISIVPRPIYDVLAPYPQTALCRSTLHLDPDTYMIFWLKDGALMSSLGYRTLERGVRLYIMPNVCVWLCGDTSSKSCGFDVRLPERIKLFT